MEIIGKKYRSFWDLKQMIKSCFISINIQPGFFSFITVFFLDIKIELKNKYHIKDIP